MTCPFPYGVLIRIQNDDWFGARQVWHQVTEENLRLLTIG